MPIAGKPPEMPENAPVRTNPDMAKNNSTELVPFAKNPIGAPGINAQA